VAAAQTPPPWLTVDDLVRVEIENIGYIENKVVMESGDSILE
jgi:2-keto-4-pentenoate hydratase/2-oxohepta-3-ene-1,7-dioic acid hydratase in catechol pathway